MPGSGLRLNKVHKSETGEFKRCTQLRVLMLYVRKHCKNTYY